MEEQERAKIVLAEREAPAVEETKSAVPFLYPLPSWPREHGIVNEI